MKKRVVLFCMGILWGITFLGAQNVPDGMLAAFKEGNAGALKGSLNDQVELTIQSHSQPLDKHKTETRLADFFAAHKVQDFRINHQGKRNETGFIVGTLITSNGEFRVNCFFKKAGGKYVIHQIRIDKSNE